MRGFKSPCGKMRYQKNSIGAAEGEGSDDPLTFPEIRENNL